MSKKDALPPQPKPSSEKPKKFEASKIYPNRTFVKKIRQQMVLEIPDQLLFKSSYTLQEFRLDVAVMLFQKQVMSLARAAEWLGISRLEFQRELKNRGVFLHYEIADLHEELGVFKKMGL